MLKKTIPYVDLNGIERKEDFYFNLSKPEIVKMQDSVKGGYDVRLKGIAAELNGAAIMEFFEDLIKRSYGEKSEDGRRFMKSEEISKAFMETPAYEVLFEELITNDKAAAEFVNAIMPADVTQKVQESMKK
jgi:hypothetical protein